VACWGGRGRTGTALAFLSVLDGLPADQAVAYVRRRYDGLRLLHHESERTVPIMGTRFTKSARF